MRKRNKENKKISFRMVFKLDSDNTIEEFVKKVVSITKEACLNTSINLKINEEVIINEDGNKTFKYVKCSMKHEGIYIISFNVNEIIFRFTGHFSHTLFDRLFQKMVLIGNITNINIGVDLFNVVVKHDNETMSKKDTLYNIKESQITISKVVRDLCHSITDCSIDDLVEKDLYSYIPIWRKDVEHDKDTVVYSINFYEAKIKKCEPTVEFFSSDMESILTSAHRVLYNFFCY